VTHGRHGRRRQRREVRLADVLKVMLLLAAVGIILIVGAVKLGYAASFYPACLKPDGDWLHGVTPQECRQLRGRWYTADVLKKARKVW
jgi:hypothetical protein